MGDTETEMQTAPTPKRRPGRPANSSRAAKISKTVRAADGTATKKKTKRAGAGTLLGPHVRKFLQNAILHGLTTQTGKPVQLTKEAKQKVYVLAERELQSIASSVAARVQCFNSRRMGSAQFTIQPHQAQAVLHE